MAKKRSEIENQIAALQAELDGADTDDEVWIKEGDREFKVTGRKATSVLGRFKDLWDDGDDGDGDGDDDDDDDGDGAPSKDKKPAGGGYFSKRGGK